MPQSSKPKCNVSKDPLDLRDLMYEGSLNALPSRIDGRRFVPFVRSQGDEGSCTGFSLAAVVNYLVHNHDEGELITLKQSASPRMLYEMARRYDEWAGTDYEGSSIRGALKGWHKHGVCCEEAWPYESGEPGGRLSRDRQEDAAKRPMGNYFRVRHLHLSHMHSALREVGILFASANTHPGWFDVNSSDGLIEFQQGDDGGHAFAIVGYDDRGFWIQNSWADQDGKPWGLRGFGRISYDDWLQNGYDCWVARLGVRTESTPSEGGVMMGRALSFGYVPHRAVVRGEIEPHLINLGRGGGFSDDGQYQTTPEDVTRIIQRDLPDLVETDGWSTPPRLLLYAHGGLNSEADSAQRIMTMKPYWLANQVYPVHFMWETGVRETFKNILLGARSDRRFGGLWDKARERFSDLMDGAVELATRHAGGLFWREMKKNAEDASAIDGHGADFTAGEIANYSGGQRPELHLVGHSAGSIVLGHLIPELEAWGLKVKTLTLYAPACTIELFEEKIAPHVGAGRCVERLTIFNLTDRAERDDVIGKQHLNLYRKSLLYLVSEAFEERKEMELLGMEKFAAESASVVKLMPNHTLSGEGTSTVIRSTHSVDGLRSNSHSHGGFDEDRDTLNSTLRLILGSTKPTRDF